MTRRESVPWQDIEIDSIWRERGNGRLIRVHRVYPPQGPQDRRLVSVMIRTVELRRAFGRVGYGAKAGSRLSFTTADRFGRDFEHVVAANWEPA